MYDKYSETVAEDAQAYYNSNASKAAGSGILAGSVMSGYVENKTVFVTKIKNGYIVSTSQYVGGYHTTDKIFASDAYTLGSIVTNFLG